MPGRVINGFEVQDLQDAMAVTPDDTNDLNVSGGGTGVAITARALYVGVSGDVTLITHHGQTVLLKSVAAGVIHRLAFTRVKATGTTATSIVALY